MCFPMKFRKILAYRMLHTSGASEWLVLFRTLLAVLVNRRPLLATFVEPAVARQGSDSVPSAPRKACSYSDATPSRTTAADPLHLQESLSELTHGRPRRRPRNSLRIGVHELPLTWWQEVSPAFHHLAMAYWSCPGD